MAMGNYCQRCETPWHNCYCGARKEKLNGMFLKLSNGINKSNTFKLQTRNLKNTEIKFKAAMPREIETSPRVKIVIDAFLRS